MYCFKWLVKEGGNIIAVAQEQYISASEVITATIYSYSYDLNPIYGDTTNLEDKIFKIVMVGS